MTNSPFTNHEIVSCYESPDSEFGTWLLKQRHTDGGWDCTFSCRVMAADGKLTVTGDFYPTVFAHGPRDPRSLVGWIGSRPTVDSYVEEKACIGMGRWRVVEWSVKSALLDLRERIAELERDGDADDLASVEALRAGLDVDPSDAGQAGVQEIVAVIATHAQCPDILDVVGAIGARPAASVVLAWQALRRLVELLEPTQPNATETTT
jgi:hypothetical protein